MEKKFNIIYCKKFLIKKKSKNLNLLLKKNKNLKKMIKNYDYVNQKIILKILFQNKIQKYI